MKTIIAFIAILLSTTSFAQGGREGQGPGQGPGKPLPPEKRWEKDSEKIKKAVSLTADELSKVKTAFMDFYKDMDALHQAKKGERPSKEEVDKIARKRNEAVKKVLSKEKFDQFMKVEKEFGPPKPPRE